MMHTRLVSLTAFSLFALFTASLLQAQTLFNVSISTTGLNGTNGGLAFDLIGGDNVTPNNTALITGFTTNGTLAAGSNMNTGTASGNLPGTLTLQDSGFSESFRGITFGNTLSYTLSLTNNFAAPGAPDEFSFFLTNPANSASIVATSDPTGADALFTLDTNGVGQGALTVFTPRTPGVSVTVRAAQQGVPEPSPLAFVGAGLLGGILMLRGILRRKPI